MRQQMLQHYATDWKASYNDCDADLNESPNLCRVVVIGNILEIDPYHEGNTDDADDDITASKVRSSRL